MLWTFIERARTSRGKPPHRHAQSHNASVNIFVDQRSADSERMRRARSRGNVGRNSWNSGYGAAAVDTRGDVGGHNRPMTHSSRVIVRHRTVNICAPRHAPRSGLFLGWFPLIAVMLLALITWPLNLSWMKWNEYTICSVAYGLKGC